MKKVKGLAVKVNNEFEFSVIKHFLSPEILYLDWVPQMSKIPTAIVIVSNEPSFSVGSVGSALYFENFGIRTVDFNDYFKSTKNQNVN